MVKDKGSLQKFYDQLLEDQLALQSLHEQLSNEHELALKEKDTLRQYSRDLSKEVKILKDLLAKQEASNSVTKQEKDALEADSISLTNLRAEHSKLKVNSY